jgi:hypothetical protein
MCTVNAEMLEKNYSGIGIPVFWVSPVPLVTD